MAPLKQEEVSTAFKIESLILKALASTGQKPLSEKLDIDESYISKLKTTDQKINLKSISEMLAILGLKVVPVDYVTMRRDDADYQRRCTISYLETLQELEP